ncbi:putative siderophore transport system ATP-binding protein YusV [compost metagenome]
MIAIKQGKAIASGTPEEVVTSEVLREVFGIEADIVTDPRSGVPLCLPYELYRAAGGKGLRSAQEKKNDEREIASKVASIL